MSPKALSASLGTDQNQVRQWIKQGMPTATILESAGWLWREGFLGEFVYQVSTLTDVARFFGVHRDTVRKDWRDAGMPGKNGNYQLHEIAEWKKARTKDSSSGNGSELQNRIKEEDWRQKKAKRRIADVHAERAEGNIFYRDELEPLIAELLTGLKFQLQLIPDAMMNSFPKEHRTKLRAELANKIDTALKRTADWLTTIDQDLNE